MEIFKSHVKKRYKDYVYFIIIYIIIFISNMYFNKEILSYFGTLFRPLEIISTFISILILKEISEIKTDYYKKARSEKHRNTKESIENLQFYSLYQKKEQFIDQIISNCENFQNMESKVTVLEEIMPFLEMFQGNISERLYESKDTRQYKNCFRVFKESIEFISNKDINTIKKRTEEYYYNNNKRLLNESVICVKSQFENNSQFLKEYVEYVDNQKNLRLKKIEKESERITDDEL